MYYDLKSIELTLNEFSWLTLTFIDIFKYIQLKVTEEGLRPLFQAKGAARVFIKIFKESTFWLFLIEETNIYQMLLVPWKNIVPSRSYNHLEVSTTV